MKTYLIRLLNLLRTRFLRVGLVAAIVLSCTRVASADGTLGVQSTSPRGVAVQSSDPGSDLFLPAYNWLDMLMNNRSRTVQAAVVFIALGIFMLRKKHYR